MMLDLLAPLIIGFLGSFHCLGMCGPLVVAYALHLRPSSTSDAASLPHPWQSGLLHLAGFLPCMLSWAMVLKAATTGSLFLGALTMVLFGLGTVPVLFLTGLSASLISMKMRSVGERIAALSIIVMGLILIFKGVRSFV